MRILFSGLMAGTLLLGCSPAGAPKEKPGAIKHDETLKEAQTLPLISEPPVGKLPMGISPLSYALNLVIDPTDKDFSGNVAIKVDLQKSLKGFWLHGWGLNIDQASLTLVDGTVIGADYQESEEPGVSLVTLKREVGPGTGTLQFEFHAPFNQSLDGLYQVKRDGRWNIPFCVSGQSTGSPFKTCTVMTKVDEILILEGTQTPDYVMPNAGGAGYYRFTLDAAGWDKLIAKANTLPASEALALTGHDPAVRDALVVEVRKFIGMDGAGEASSLVSEDMGIAFAAAVQDEGKPFVEALRTLLEQERNPAVRAAALQALAATRDASIAADLRDWAMGDVLTGREAMGLIGGLMFGPLADDGWAWFTAHFDDVLSRMPDVRKSAAPNFANGFCDADKRDAVEAFFTAQADKTPGYERSLAQTLEGISLCVAFKGAKGEELAKALESRG